LGKERLFKITNRANLAMPKIHTLLVSIPQGLKDVSANSIGLGSPIDWHAHSSRVRQLIVSRGGLGPQVTRSDIEAGSKKMDWTQWQAYKRKN